MRTSVKSLGVGIASAVFAASALAEGDIYVVPKNENATAPYDTWATASANIVDAINNAAPSSTVHVAAGLYLTTSSIVVPLGVKVLGATGNPDDVTIDSQFTKATYITSSTRTITATKGDAYIANITIRGGHIRGSSSTTAWGGGLSLGNGGTVSNCHITACRTKAYAGGAGMYINGANAFDVLVDCCTNAPVDTDSSRTVGYAVSVSGASLVERCQIINNVATTGRANNQYFGGGALAIQNISNASKYKDTCLVRNCLVAHNTIQNVLNANNGILASGVWAYGGTVENCTIVSNVTAGADSATFGVKLHETTTPSAIFRNCHIADNYRGDGTTNNYSTSSTSAASDYYKYFEYCCTTPLHAKFTKCVLDDTSKYGFDSKGRLFIQKDSPCFGAASAQAWMEGAKDLYGRARILNGACDIGAVEYMNAFGTIIFVR